MYELLLPGKFTVKNEITCFLKIGSDILSDGDVFGTFRLDARTLILEVKQKCFILVQWNLL